MDRLKALKFDDSKAACNLIYVIKRRQRRRLNQFVEEVNLLMAPFVPGVQ